MERQDPLVSADWLRQNFEADGIRILDATWVPPFLKDRPNGVACYTAEHIPGATYFDIDTIADLETSLKHMLPDASHFAAQVGALGVSKDTHVIIYDSNGFFASARVWWMFRAMGHDKVHVLDGGLAAWKTAGGPTSTNSPDIVGTNFNATPRPDLVRDLTAMRQHVDAQDAFILDARAQGRFDGTSPEPRPDLPSGHMPGSFCVPATSLIAQNGTMKSVEDLRPLLENYVGRPVITSCGSGVSAAVISLALARMGNWDAAVYDGSWSEWAAGQDNPIATTP